MERGYIITNLKDHHKISNLYKHPIDDKELNILQIYSQVL